MTQPTIDLQDPQTKAALTEVVIDLLKNRRELLHEIILEAMEEVGLATAIQEGRQNDFVDESEIFAILDGDENSV
ncbi:MAG: hypothetical protein ACPGVO_09560 [Spirulinaceae cyanobacterium]